MNDPKCGVCGEPKSAHVATEKGEFTHPREARGEGHYELVRDGYTHGGESWYDDKYVPPLYRFVSVGTTKQSA
jgi:hypothetical protein